MGHIPRRQYVWHRLAVISLTTWTCRPTKWHIFKCHRLFKLHWKTSSSEMIFEYEMFFFYWGITKINRKRGEMNSQKGVKVPSIFRCHLVWNTLSWITSGSYSLDSQYLTLLPIAGYVQNKAHVTQCGLRLSNCWFDRLTGSSLDHTHNG